MSVDVPPEEGSAPTILSTEEKNVLFLSLLERLITTENNIDPKSALLLTAWLNHRSMEEVCDGDSAQPLAVFEQYMASDGTKRLWDALQWLDASSDDVEIDGTTGAALCHRCGHFGADTSVVHCCGHVIAARIKLGLSQRSDVVQATNDDP